MHYITTYYYAAHFILISRFLPHAYGLGTAARARTARRD